MYDYLEQVTADVRDYVEQEIDLTEWAGDRDGLEEKLNNDLWTCDSVTGNASGSYYCNTWKAEEALAHNWDLLAEALEEFGQNGTDVLKEGAEAMDVTIRCYLLGQAITAVLDDLEEDRAFEEEEEEDFFFFSFLAVSGFGAGISSSSAWSSEPRFASMSSGSVMSRTAIQR